MTVKKCRLFCVACLTVFIARAAALAGDEKVFDAAPFAFVDSDPDGKFYDLRWSEPRKIRRVVVSFDTTVSLPADKVKLQYWHNAWDGKADPIIAEAGVGGQGWAAIDDWTNGKWKDADTNMNPDNSTWTFTFAPSGTKEFKDLGQSGVTYRKTIKIRLHADSALPKTIHVQAFTDSALQPLKARVLFGAPAEGGIKVEGAEQGTLEAYNGMIAGQTNWKFTGQDGEVPVEMLMAVDPIDARYDHTIVTVRSKQRPFSFAADEVARGDRIFVDDLGALVVRGDDPITLQGYRDLHKGFPGRTVYDRITDHEEQTLMHARNQMPIRRPMEFVHGLPGNRNVMKQLPNGEIVVDGFPFWLDRPKSPKDTGRKKWGGDMLYVQFGLPASELRGGRELKDGYLPLLRSWWQDGSIFYEMRTIMDKFDPDFTNVELDDPTVLLVRIRMVNTSGGTESGEARLLFGTHGEHQPDEMLTIDGQHAWADFDGKKRFRFKVDTHKRGRISQEGKGVRWSLKLEPGQSHEIFVAVPSITLEDKEIETLDKHDFDPDAQRLCDYWKKLTDEGTQIQTPEPWINGFYKSHLRHMLINCKKEPGSDLLFPHVGTFRYGVYANESVMMVSDLDYRGYHDLARRCLDSWVKYQGTVMLNGNFKSKDGIYYGVNQHESGSYNKHHGYVMWCMAEHWWQTHDKEWLGKVAPSLIKACDWVINERLGTMKRNGDDSLPIEYGFLPAGGLEDVQDYWYWLATNAATVWGFDAVAAALADFGGIEKNDVERLREESLAYHDNVIRNLNEARVRSPVVRLRDGTYVPKYPSDVHTRGRAYGWIRETLEGSIFLPVMGLLDPNSIDTKWIMKDYEDNLYISDRYGYSVPVFDEFWFSRGGFSMQANLLDGPIPYIKRDDIKHFLRAYFNGFAANFDQELHMMSEHSLPELGYPVGDHFKTSDEGQSNYWLRLMFVREQGDELFLGQAIPRYWLADGQNIGIERAASHFGPMSLQYVSSATSGKIKATLTPPTRNALKAIYLRFRHPQGKPIKSVTVNGKPFTDFDAKKEWVVLPGKLDGKQEIVAQYE